MPKKLTREEFINKSVIIHNNKYDYSLVNYINNRIKIKIICPIHNEFEQIPKEHLNGSGCQKCGGNIKKTTEEFIIDAKKIHNNEYDYSLVKYVNNKIKVEIICKKHGIFKQTPNSHLFDVGCPKCYGTHNYTKEEFIEIAKKIHNNKFDYSLVEYVNTKIKIKIICSIHGEFLQRPHEHLNGNGCPICKESKGEKQIKKHLNDNNIKYETQKTFDGCKYIGLLKFDFYLSKYNICIEYDGRQHFESVDYWGGKNELLNIQERDKIKTDFCKNNNIKLIRIKYNENIDILEKQLNINE